MNHENEPVRFGDVVKLQTKSAFVESAANSCLGFLELLNKAQTPLLVVPPVKDEVKERFCEAEFIIAPIRGEKMQSNGTPLTFETPFVLRTSDGKDGSTYSLNNKVAGQRDGISLQVSATKGEMYIQVEKEGGSDLLYGTDGLSLRVVDSNRVRKTLNHLLTHAVRPKSEMPGGMVLCGAKGSALTFSFQRAVDGDGQVKSETIKIIKNPQTRRTSIETPSPTKINELGRADRIDSSEFSDVDAMSRSSSIVGFGSNPASPRSSSMTSGLATPVNAAAVAERLPVVMDVDDPETEATASSCSVPSSSNEGLPSMPVDSATDVSCQSISRPASSSKHVATITSPLKSATKGAKSKESLASTPIQTIASVSPLKTKKAEAEPIKTESTKTEPIKTEQVKAVTASIKTTGLDETKPKMESSKPIKAAATTSPLVIPNPATAEPHEPRTIVADATTFPPMPVINGPAPAPVVMTPKSSASPKTTPRAAPTLMNVPLESKMLSDEEVARLKAEAEIENLDPACGAKCSLM